ncbi:MAG: sel1 repeat family protein [Rhodospirillales bacterium]|nr:sel1 repeat family protein [Rhodospirillales bacterium]
MRRTLFGILTVLAACSQTAEPRTVTVCTGGHCVQQDPSVVTTERAAVAPTAKTDSHIADLEALAQNDPSAAYDLALRYFRGDGVPQDSYRALQWMRSAAERGNVPAQTALGRLYFTGLEEMGSDLNEASRWLSAAAASGDGEARKLLVEVQEAQANDAVYRRQLTDWRYQTYYYWSQGLSYRWYWNTRYGRYYPY